MDNFKLYIKTIIKNIIEEIIKLINYNFNEHPDTFYNWFMTNADYDFVYIYEMGFKKYFLDNFTIETERILSYYSQNLIYAISTYYEIYRDLPAVEFFINIFITKQFEYIDQHQLFLS